MAYRPKRRWVDLCTLCRRPIYDDDSYLVPQASRWRWPYVILHKACWADTPEGFYRLELDG